MSKGKPRYLVKQAIHSLPLQVGRNAWNLSGDLQWSERRSLVVRVVSGGTTLMLLELPYLGGGRRMVGTEKRYDRWDPIHLYSIAVVYSNLQLLNIFKKGWKTGIWLMKSRNRILVHFQSSPQCWAKLMGRLWPYSKTGHDSSGKGDWRKERAWSIRITTVYTAYHPSQQRKGDNSESNAKGKCEFSITGPKYLH